MKVPDIETYSDYREFFRDFIDQNKALGPKYSYRYFAKKLGWPISLIHDVISGRKSLSITRCLEFSAFANLDDIKTKHFVFLCIDASVSDTYKATIARLFCNKLYSTLDPKKD